MIPRALCLLLALSACEGLGRPIVGTRPLPVPEDTRRCEVTPECVPVRTVDPALFAIPPERLLPPSDGDCDGDSIPDAMDGCLGVPNEPGDVQECDEAQASCERLRDGAIDFEGADLRGCRIEAPIQLAPGFSLRGADLTCASLTFVEPSAQERYTIDVSAAALSGASLAFEAPLTALIVDLERSELSGTLVRTAGGVRLRAREATLASTTLALAPSEGAPDPSPALAIIASDLEDCAIYEAPSAWPARVRIERSTVRSTTFDVAALELVGGRMSASHVSASELLALNLDLVTSAVNTPYGAFAMCDLHDVIFARCDDLFLAGGALRSIDIPECQPDRLHVVEAVLTDAHLAGGLRLEASRLLSSTLGGGPTSTVTTAHSELDAVTICDLGAAAFEGGELTCVKCEEDAFMDGTSVCVSGAHLVERGCPPIELAPLCL